MENYYKILDIHPTASQEEIRERYRFLANAYHPDKFSNPTHKTEAEEEFKKINQAYQVLSIPAKRAEYDRRLGLTPSPRPSGQYRRSNPSPRPSSRQSPDIYAIGQAVIRTIAFAFIFYIASFIALRMGIGGVVLFLLLLGVIYMKYFWK